VTKPSLWVKPLNIKRFVKTTDLKQDFFMQMIAEIVGHSNDMMLIEDA